MVESPVGWPLNLDFLLWTMAGPCRGCQSKERGDQIASLGGSVEQLGGDGPGGGWEAVPITQEGGDGGLGQMFSTRTFCGFPNWK